MALGNKGGRPVGTGRDGDDIPWDFIKRDYMAGDRNLRALSIKYDCSRSSVSKRKNREHWDDDAMRHAKEMAQSINERVMTDIMETEGDRLKGIIKRQETISDMLLAMALKQARRFNEEGVTYDRASPKGVLLGKLQGEADASNKIVHNIKNAVILQRQILGLEKAYKEPTEQDVAQLVSFVEADAPDNAVVTSDTPPGDPDDDYDESEVRQQRGSS